MILRLPMLLLAATTFAASFFGPANAAPRVVVSIQPLHSLVAAVMNGAGSPQLLLPPTTSPHAYSLRPTDAAALATAEVVFWTGLGLEMFLEGPLSVLAEDATVVALTSTPGIELLYARTARLGVGDQEYPDGFDVHFWLDPRNARVIVAAVAKLLATADADNATIYAANAASADRRLQALDSEIAAMLATVRGIGFLTFHDSLQYFARRYELTDLGSLTVSSDHAPGARTMLAARRQLAKVGTECAAAEPQTPAGLAAALLSGTNSRLAVVDPLGSGIAPGPAAYGEILRNLAETLLRCLAPSA